MKIALAQINTTVGDFEGNSRLILAALEAAEAASARLLVLPELALCGYPPLDLLTRPAFISATEAALAELAARTRGTYMLVGFAERVEAETGLGLYNAAALLGEGRVLAVRRKSLLPTYDVFDEARYFDAYRGDYAPIEIDGLKLGVTICEDIWNDRVFWPKRRYDCDPVEALAAAGAQAIINLSASPYHMGKPALRQEMLAAAARRHGLPVVYCNLVGGNDELIFEGGSMVLDAAGQVIARARRFDAAQIYADLFDEGAASAPLVPCEERIDDTREALLLGLRDYCRKCGFSRVVLGLSGGIDSAVVAALAVEALGAEAVVGVGMPSHYSSEGSVTDARALAENLGIEFHVLPIADAYQAVAGTLAPLFAGTEEGVAEENIQARLRGMLLMAHTNKFGGLLLTTGNKSELAVGYCTLYGDMSGGLAVISDLPKGLVYKLAHHLNRHREVIPVSTLTKPPSAELRPDQLDADSLPDYDVLDDLLVRYVEHSQPRAEIIAAGYAPALVDDIIRKVDRNEYKRRQAAPGLRVTAKAFGIGRRIPIAQRFSG
ncbi:NAD+ synthase [Myxococcota bacterium]|nr:NAD+ synthase [Myxococcota bacterium]MBU1432236.1 NAD+ synthase [Myxococcota bacterium]MBU1897845.1 NAD+ synthase [Myxococcota bacterium]